MSFTGNYFGRFNAGEKIFNNNPCHDTGIIVVIPCYNDHFIFNTLKSLDNAKPASVKTEVIVIVNSGENTSSEIVNANRDIFRKLLSNQASETYNNFKLLVHNVENTPKKKAGVGHARKTGMDEAIHRFNSINNPGGIIASLDADCLVSENYFQEIENYFINNPGSGACTLQFRHNFDYTVYSNEIISACMLYEIYLRYFRLSLQYCGFPYPLHTIGSCFCVNAGTYVKAGGMSQRQGGEDFYFLHKLAPMTKVGKINKAVVFPSPRISDRVPFGTGPAVNKIISEKTYNVYNFELFTILKKYYSVFVILYSTENISSVIPEEIIDFYGKTEIEVIIKECKDNTGNLQAFNKRMFSKFDAFFAVRFLNSFDTNSKFPPVDIITAAKQLFETTLTKSDYNSIEELYSLMVKADECDPA